MYYRYRKTGDIYILYGCKDNNGTYKEEYHPYNDKSLNNIVLSKMYMDEQDYMGYLYQLRHMANHKDLQELKDYHYKLYLAAVNNVNEMADKIFEKYEFVSHADNYHDVNEINLRSTNIKQYVSSGIIEYTLDEKPIYDYRKPIENIKIVTGVECPMCGTEMKCDPDSQFLTPPKYRYVCPKCMYVTYLSDHDNR